ncbi:competence protein CoiA [Streptococcus caprae]|uniref:Competence protein CoiA n=1 Tax=Streptococcus caprae TaxID=1640501 RepID=A0ABV8CVB3_9STRE
MLTALDKKGRKISLLGDALPSKQEFSCPGCGQALILRKGSRYRPHFAHTSLATCTYHFENESAEHLGLKAALYRTLSETEEVQIEAVLPELQQIADLLVNGQLALEVQCSPLSIERLRERTEAYHDHGFQVLWMLGKKLWLDQRLTQLQRDFLYFSRNVGFYLWELDVLKREVRLQYLIHEDLRGRLHYLTKTFSLDQLSLGDLRFPYQQQRVQPFKVKQDQQIVVYARQQLFYRHPKWLSWQAKVYEQGDNLLTWTVRNFSPQLNWPRSDQGFAQVKEDLADYYRAFDQFYRQDKPGVYQTLYPPAFLLKQVNQV